MFRVIEEDSDFDMGEILTLESDDGSDCPYFWNADKSDACCAYWSELEPIEKTIRDAQVGDVVVRKVSKDKRMVLGRWQNTIMLSLTNNFKRTGFIFTLDELEEDFTLKNAPEVGETLLTMDQIAEKFGVEVSNLKIAKE